MYQSQSTLSNMQMTDSNISKFSKLLPLCIRKEGGMMPGESSSSSTGSHAEQKEAVRVTLTYPSPACGAMNPHKEISLRLTNDDNPMFFYHLRITEADFPELKSQQGLLVDFFGFPNQLVNLLERCDSNYSEDSPGYGTGGPKFVLVMKIGVNSTVLDVVESNPFKYLCHLSLQINAGLDAEVKKYLCDVTTNLKKDYQLLQDKYNHLASAMESETARMKAQIEYKAEELGQVRDELHAQENSLSTKHFQDMTQEKEKLLKLQSELATKFEDERKELNKRNGEVIANLEERISALEAENRALIQCKYKNETSLQEAGNKMKHYVDDLKLLQQEITLVKKQNEKLDQDYHEKQRFCGNLQNKLSSLENDAREKQNILQRQHEQLTQISEQKKFLEDHATGMVKEVEKVKSVNKMVSGELIKANEIIKKLQDDIRNLNSKTKLQTQVALEQERAIADRDKQISQLETEAASLRTSISAMESETAKTIEACKDSESKIETMEKTIKSNENMISWLNKQLNEFQGLSNLTKFRQNLGLNYKPSEAGNENMGLPHNSPLENNYNTNTSEAVQNKALAVDKFGSSMGGSMSGRHPVGVFTNNQMHNTLPAGTPSWMHIYQSTSTPLENDLSSRLEKVSSGMNNNYQSRFTGRHADEANHIVLTKTDDNVEDSVPVAVDPKPKSTSAANSKAPTWAKSRVGKVTLDVGTSSRGRGILRR